jgi:hypothetical protein
MLGLRITTTVVVVFFAGCAVPPAWPPRVDRLPEAAAGPLAPTPSAVPTLDEIVQMAASGTPSGVIIQKLRDSRAMYSISPEQTGTLAVRGVPPEVVAYLRYGEEALNPALFQAPAYSAFPYGYPYLPPYYGYYSPGAYAPYWRYPYGPGYPHSGVFFGFSRRW